MIIHFMRHGETTGDVEDRYGGDYEDELTGHGRRQAVERVGFLKRKRIQHVFTSPRIRAQQTAAIVSEALGVQSEVMDGWRERNAYGVLTGIRKPIAKCSHPEVVRLVQDYRNTAPGAESYDELRMRLAATLDILVHEPYGEVLVITHSGVMRCLAREYLNKELKSVGDCAVLSVETTDAGLRLIDSEGLEFD